MSRSKKRKIQRRRAQTKAKPKPNSEKVTKSYEIRNNHHNAPSAIRRGQVWFVVSDPKHPSVGAETWADRYAVIVSAPPVCDLSKTVCVVWCSTSQKRRIATPYGPTHVRCHINNKDSVIVCEQVTTVDKSRLHRYVCDIDDMHMALVDKALCASLSVTRSDAKSAFGKWESAIRKFDIPLGFEAINDNDSVYGGLKHQNALLAAERDGYRILFEATKQRLDDAITQLEETNNDCSVSET